MWHLVELSCVFPRRSSHQTLESEASGVLVLDLGT